MVCRALNRSLDAAAEIDGFAKLLDGSYRTVDLCGSPGFSNMFYEALDRRGFLFRTSRSRRGDVLSERPMRQTDAWRMIRRRAGLAGIVEPIGCHSFRATGITAYLSNGGTLEHAQAMATHESPRTTKLYDRTQDRLTQDDVQRIRL